MGPRVPALFAAWLLDVAVANPAPAVQGLPGSGDGHARFLVACLSIGPPCSRRRLNGCECPVPTVITKLDAAKRQLCSAIRMFFADDDAISVYTLANAALEIFEGRPKKVSQRGPKTRLFDILRTIYPNLSKKEAWDRVHKVKNFFKHRGSLKSVVFHEEANDSVLLFACSNCVNQTAPAQPAEVEAFVLWWIATQAEIHEPDWKDRIDKLYPGVRTASRQEKKRFGIKLIEDAVAGRLSFRISQFGAFTPGANPVPDGDINMHDAD
jgi:hypothetical protein